MNHNDIPDVTPDEELVPFEVDDAEADQRAAALRAGLALSLIHI